MAMVAVGGSIGTGLLLGSGAAVHIAGPSVILTYAAGAFLAWTVTCALGELASAHPAAGSFGLYGELYLHPWAGFVARYGYWYAVVMAVGAELVAAATYSRYWLPSVPGLAWIAVYSAILLLINLRAVGDFGRFEYWFSMVKVVTIVTFVLAGAWLLFGGRATAQYQQHGGFFPNGTVSPLLAVSFALFSFLGIEMVAISSGEARAAREIPRATKIAFALLAFVYLGATAVLVGVLPWDRAGVLQSPFVTVFVVAKIPAASSLMNFVVLTAALSSANANLYVASRMLFSLARGGYAPPALGRLKFCRLTSSRSAYLRWRDPPGFRDGALDAAICVSLYHRRLPVYGHAELVDCTGCAHRISPPDFAGTTGCSSHAVAGRRSPVGHWFHGHHGRRRFDLVGSTIPHHDPERAAFPGPSKSGIRLCAKTLA